jgi:signal transduction histidine kinase/DNA-binding LacI/PurR family transcriptional regulator
MLINSRPTVAWVTQKVACADEDQLWAGLEAGAQEGDLNLVCVRARDLRSLEGWKAETLGIQRMVEAGGVQAVVVWGGSLVQYHGAAMLKALCDACAPVPVVCVALSLDGVPSICCDNYGGMLDAVRHLVEEHGRRRIAFVRGPEGHGEAEDRFRAYRDALAECNVAFDPFLVSPPGGFMRADGEDAVRIFLDERRVKFDALAASDDNSALGALRALRAREIPVPEAVGLVGFDDIEEGQSSLPPLTSPRNDFFELGRRAVREIGRALRGQPIPLGITIPAQLRIRQSCGCLLRSVSEASVPASTPGERSAGAAPSDRERMSLEVSRSWRGAKGGIDPRCQELVDAFFAAMDDGNDAPLRSRFEELAAEAQSVDTIASVHSVLSTLRRLVLPVLSESQRLRAENVFQRARVSIGEVAMRHPAQRQFGVEQRSLVLATINQALITTFDVGKLMEVLAAVLPQLGMKRVYVSLREKDHPEASRLVLAYDENGRRALPSGGLVFRTADLVPEGWLARDQRTSLVVQTLYFREEQLGHAVFEPGPIDSLTYEVLRGHISSALKGAILVREMDRRNVELAESHVELEVAYQNLRRNQNALLLSEKMASLGRLTAGIAHELNTPLAAVRASLADVRRLLAECRSSLEDPRVEPGDYREMYGEMLAGLDLAERAAEGVVGFVRGIKAQTRDLDARQKEPFNAVGAVRDCLLLLAHKVRDRKCALRFESSVEAVELWGSPGRLAQVVTNLVTNAIDAVPGEGEGQVEVRLEKQQDRLELDVIDNGLGIAESDLPRIFEPMFTTKKFGEGMGLGLAIVHDIVIGEFGGTIDVDSKPGRRTTFKLSFPLRGSA